MTTTTHTDEQTARLDLTKAIAAALLQDNKTRLQKHGLKYNAVTKGDGEILETIGTPHQGDTTSRISFHLGVNADGRAYATGFAYHATSDMRRDRADSMTFPARLYDPWGVYRLPVMPDSVCFRVL